jgi:hypothetical protein
MILVKSRDYNIQTRAVLLGLFGFCDPKEDGGVGISFFYSLLGPNMMMMSSSCHRDVLAICT